MIIIECKEVSGFSVLNENVNKFIMLHGNQVWTSIEALKKDAEADHYHQIFGESVKKIEQLYYEKYPKI